MKYYSGSEAETRSLGRELARGFSGGETVLLFGDLGAGKTVFAKGIAEGLGIAERVTSPTFTIGASYEGRLKLHHFDMYRIGGEEEAEETGITEFLGAKGGVCVIEWPQNIAGLLPRGSIKVRLSRAGEGREIEIE